MPRLRLAFMGTPDFAVPALSALVEAGHQVAAVYTQPPREAGRGQKPRPSSVHRAALERGISVRTPASLKGSAPRPYAVSVGKPITPPRRRIAKIVLKSLSETRSVWNTSMGYWRG